MVAGDVVGRIFDPYDLFNDQQQTVTTRHAGVVIGINNNPLTHEGDALMNIARFERAEDVAEEVEAIHQDLLGEPQVERWV